jgi:hypothetical protein
LRSLEDEPWDTNNHPIEEVSVDPTEIGETAEKKLDAEVSGLFDEARDKLEKIDEKADRQKKQIVVELAKDLDDKIRTDSICMEIVDALRGQVSPRFIRECLDEKYKQKPRMQNARKQQKRLRRHQPDSIDNLAALPPLNQEAEPKKVVMLGVEGEAMLQEEEEEHDPDDEGDGGDAQSTITIESSTTKCDSLTQLEPPYPQEQQKEPEKPSTAYPNGNDLRGEDAEPEEDLEVPSQFIGQDEAAHAFTHNNKPDEPEGVILNFEFSMVFRDIRNHMATIFKNVGDRGNVWFSGKIDRKTGKVISAGFGRLNQ